MPHSLPFEQTYRGKALSIRRLTGSLWFPGQVTCCAQNSGQSNLILLLFSISEHNLQKHLTGIAYVWPMTQLNEALGQNSRWSTHSFSSKHKSMTENIWAEKSKRAQTDSKSWYQEQNRTELRVLSGAPHGLQVWVRTRGRRLAAEGRRELKVFPASRGARAGPIV